MIEKALIDNIYSLCQAPTKPAWDFSMACEMWSTSCQIERNGSLSAFATFIAIQKLRQSRLTPAEKCFAGSPVRATLCNDTETAAETSAWSTNPLASQRWCSFLPDGPLLCEAEAKQIKAAKDWQNSGSRTSYTAGKKDFGRLVVYWGFCSSRTFKLNIALGA